ncbi:hypothetical protein FA15DRAFT_656839 [Coprinopsis marcescibilis]|uniref:Uncharacterized protein n=1 Tax=Coprinopsis marcescibilis TaxID=230819 RepID=A0A5C3KS39_COPMA|nr:hypothetical protein FA15DRAFT_656839 [Coprinopsis marcescibilis]
MSLSLLWTLALAKGGFQSRKGKAMSDGVGKERRKSQNEKCGYVRCSKSRESTSQGFNPKFDIHPGYFHRGSLFVAPVGKYITYTPLLCIVIAKHVLENTHFNQNEHEEGFPEVGIRQLTMRSDRQIRGEKYPRTDTNRAFPDKTYDTIKLNKLTSWISEVDARECASVGLGYGLDLEVDSRCFLELSHPSESIKTWILSKVSSETSL